MAAQRPWPTLLTYDHRELSAPSVSSQGVLLLSVPPLSAHTSCLFPFVTPWQKDSNSSNVSVTSTSDNVTYEPCDDPWTKTVTFSDIFVSMHRDVNCICSCRHQEVVMKEPFYTCCYHTRIKRQRGYQTDCRKLGLQTTEKNIRL